MSSVTSPPIDVIVGQYHAKFYDRKSEIAKRPVLVIDMGDIVVWIYTPFFMSSGENRWDDTKQIFAVRGHIPVKAPPEVFKLRAEIDSFFDYYGASVKRSVLVLMSSSLGRADGDHAVLWRVFGFLQHT